MAQGMSELERRINEFNQAKDELKETVREAHSVLKELRHTKREIDQLMTGEAVRELVDVKVHETIQVHLDRIGPEVSEQTKRIYERVNEQVILLINIALGKPGKIKGKNIDVRPALAEKLRAWIMEVIEEQIRLGNAEEFQRELDDPDRRITRAQSDAEESG